MMCQFSDCSHQGKLSPFRSSYPSTVPVDTSCGSGRMSKRTLSSQLVAVVSSPGQNRSLLLHFVSQIKFLASQRSECSFVKVERSQVRVSHDLANLARLENLNATWLGTDLKLSLRLLTLIDL
jgi:hypothetical protein